MHIIIALIFRSKIWHTARFRSATRPLRGIFRIKITRRRIFIIFQTVKKLIHCERKGSGNEAFPEFNPQAEFISAEENPVFLRPDKVQGFPQK